MGPDTMRRVIAIALLNEWISRIQAVQFWVQTFEAEAASSVLRKLRKRLRDRSSFRANPVVSMDEMYSILEECKTEIEKKVQILNAKPRHMKRIGHF
mgnify:CR=1 FL=1